MLQDFFSITLEEQDINNDMQKDEESKGESKQTKLVLKSLPNVLPGFKPFAQELPMFLLRLASDVDFSDE